MEYSFYDFLKLIGSLGLFLYGMKIMSEGLQKVAGDRLRSILTAMTTNRVTGVLTGVLITALIQSSSATTVMVVSFVNAGLLTLAESISVIMGANIGTTVTAWIISIFGFKVDMAAFALPLLAIALPLIFSGKSNRKSIGEFIFGFSFLFMGLSYLKDRYQVQFPVKNFCTYCYNVVYNSLPVLLFSNLEELKKAGIRDFRMDFTMESAKETKAILKLYEEFADGSRRQYPKEWENRYTNGHYKRGVE